MNLKLHQEEKEILIITRRISKTESQRRKDDHDKERETKIYMDTYGGLICFLKSL